MKGTLIPVIDVFAGPGGLGEGFSAFGREKGRQYFKIGVSVEKEESAHKTLLLRSFFRQFPHGAVPSEYYSFLRGEISREKLFKQYPVQAEAAGKEAWKKALGSGPEFNEELDQRISAVIKGHDKWILIGGPPCQAYSLIGRSRNVGKKDYCFEEDARSFLYKEYLRIIAKHQPPMFVMENVKGILSSKAYGSLIFDSILRDLQDPAAAVPEIAYKKRHKYRICSLAEEPKKRAGNSDSSLLPEDYIVKCERYGIPQARHRVILLGIREDFAFVKPGILKPEEPVFTESVLNGLPALRSGLSKKPDSQEVWQDKIAGIAGQQWVSEVRSSFRPGIYDLLMSALATPVHSEHDRGNNVFIRCNPSIDERLKDWFIDPQMGGVCNHSTRGHIYADIQRYFFASCFAKLYGSSPKLPEYPKELLPKHKSATTGHFSDRFRVQAYGRPSMTITSHISKDGHYYIHPDPCQCRSLTVREAARLQTFPDNYFFCGNRTQQYVQVGNAVPPLLAYKIAEIVYRFLKRV